MRSLFPLAVLACWLGAAVPSWADPVRMSPAYQDGQRDRQVWEKWFASLHNQVRAGAEYWATHRQTPHPGNCDRVTNPDANASWIEGCQEAQRRLAVIDARRQAEPDYRRGHDTLAVPGGKAARPGTDRCDNPVHRRMSFRDFAVDGEEYASLSRKVSIDGHYVKSGAAEILVPSPADIARLESGAIPAGDMVHLLIGQAARPAREFLYDCRRAGPGGHAACPTRILGTVTRCTITSTAGVSRVEPCIEVKDACAIP